MMSLSAGVLTGDMVNVSHQGPAVGAIYQNMGTQAITDGGFTSYLYDGAPTPRMSTKTT